ncbi:hypothetical protein LZ30DRAFT_624187, partial [Colletotrichum cereale]
MSTTGASSISSGTSTSISSSEAASTTSISLSSAAPLPSGFPAVSNGFRFLGCLGSSDNFPSLQRIASSNTMSIDSCTLLCAGSVFGGMYVNDCYCGQAISSLTTLVTTTFCTNTCPGNSSEICGGDRTSLRIRQNIPNSILLTFYIAISSDPSSSASLGTTIPISSSMSATLPSITTPSGLASSLATLTDNPLVTTTVTFVTTTFVSTCPPNLLGCSVRVPTAVTVTAIETFSPANCPYVWCPRPSLVYCYSGHCYENP